MPARFLRGGVVLSTISLLDKSFACKKALPVLQAHAWLTLGNICLLDEAQAKKNILLFVDSLHTAPAPAVSLPPKFTCYHHD